MLSYDVHITYLLHTPMRCYVVVGGWVIIDEGMVSIPPRTRPKNLLCKYIFLFLPNIVPVAYSTYIHELKWFIVTGVRFPMMDKSIVW